MNMARAPLICVVDDDESILESVPCLLQSFGFDVEAFPSAEAFLDSNLVAGSDCLLLDVCMPGTSGPTLQATLCAAGLDIPTVFMTARVEEALRHRVFRQGAIDLLPKPFSEEALLSAIHRAIRSRERREATRV